MALPLLPTEQIDQPEEPVKCHSYPPDLRRSQNDFVSALYGYEVIVLGAQLSGAPPGLLNNHFHQEPPTGHK